MGILGPALMLGTFPGLKWLMQYQAKVMFFYKITLFSLVAHPENVPSDNNNYAISAY